MHLIGGGLSIARLDLRAVASKQEFIERSCAAAGELCGITPALELDLPCAFKSSVRYFIADNCRHATLAAVWLQPGQWLLGGSWDESRWGGEVPEAGWLDGCAPAVPAFLLRMDSHMALANSAALQLAGVGAETPDPQGGVIVRCVWRITASLVGWLPEDMLRKAQLLPATCC